MKIAIVGTGYVGLVTAACLAEAGNQVHCVDKEASKVASLHAGKVPFHEPDLDSLVRTGVHSGRLGFTTSLKEGVAGADMVFLAIGTPAGSDGNADLTNLMDCAHALAGLLRDDVVVVVKSTVPVGTCERIQDIFNLQAKDEARPCTVAVASNPEFLAEGHAVENFRHPDRIVVGTSEARAHAMLQTLYAPFDPTGERWLPMNVRSAEFAKYACNAMLAARVSMINELANIAGQLGADIDTVCGVLRTDPRIGPRYLTPGAGYGGSCLPKDLRALINMAHIQGEPAHLLRSVERVNRRQGELLFQAIAQCFSDGLQGCRIAIWGLSFKAGTDDVRAAPSLTLIRALLAAGASVQAYDPVASHVVRVLISDPGLTLAKTAEQACTDADALVVMTEWDEFRHPDFMTVARMLAGTTVFDARHLYRPDVLRQHKLMHYLLGQKPDTPIENAQEAGPRHGTCYGEDVLSGGSTLRASQTLNRST